MLREFRYLIELLLFISFSWILRRLPHSMLFWSSSVIGRCLFWIPPARKLTLDNVKCVFPENTHKRNKQIACKSLINTVQTIFEFVWFSGDNQRLDRFFDASLNINTLADQKGKEGKGVIFIASHIGNWELGGLIFSHRAKQVAYAVARKINNPYLDKLIIKMRSAEGMRIIPAKGATRMMVKALKEHQVVITLIDQNTRVRDGGIWTEFLGHKVPSSKAPAILARKLNVDICIVGCIRLGRRYVTFAEPLSKRIDEFNTDEEIIDDIMRITEAYVRKFPEQYLWLYKRFQYIPENVTEAEMAKYPSYSKKVRPRFYCTKVPKDKNFFV